MLKMIKTLLNTAENALKLETFLNTAKNALK